MEDCNALMADCIVISCCCQCLILQLIVFVLLKLPKKMAKKTKAYAQRKLRRRRNERRAPHEDRGDEFVGVEAIEVNYEWENCMEEVEKVMGDLSKKGEFAFGSFWSGDCESCSKYVVTRDRLEYGGHVVKFHLIEVIGPFSSSS